jgi:hypothetical protein
MSEYIEDTATLCAVIHGEPGVGKSTLAASAPGPVLVLDAEGGFRFIKGRKIRWDPVTEPVPEAGDWDYCIVPVMEWATVHAAHKVLQSGQHPFNAVVLDSLTEIQKRLVDNVAGVEQPSQQQWGQILRSMEDFVRKLRDLTFHPITPVQAVIFLCLTHHRDGVFRPFVKGSLELSLPAFVDMVGYLYTQTDASGGIERVLLIQPTSEFEAKDRTGVLTETYGSAIPSPNFIEIIDTIQTLFT